MMNIQLPQSGTNNNDFIQVEKNLVIVGANGAGKTRLGSKIEQLNNPKKRISAQRYLQLTEAVQKQDFDTALNQLERAYENVNPVQPQNDYQQVLIALFAEDARRNEGVVQSIRSGAIIQSETLPSSVKEKVMEVWDFIFPYRGLRLEKDRVRGKAEGGEFSGSEMSDGEKVGLYLISQVLLAKANSLLIIDEPELHLHKSLMVRLWNKLEEVRPDCTFVYITHDLDFAVSKPASKILWIQEFKNNIWKWVELDRNEIIPENLFLEVLGSRKPVLFVEGEKGSLDAQVYQSYYEDFTVIPRGSCEKVIESVKGMRENGNLHDKQVFGLIDRDNRSVEQLESLKNSGVFSINLSEIENIFLVPEILQFVCDYLGKPEKAEDIKSQIREFYKTNKDSVLFGVIKYRTQRILGEKIGKIKNLADYEVFKESIFKEIDGEISNAVLPDENDDIIEILKVYPHKGLVGLIQEHLEFKKNGYKNLVLSFFSSEKRKDILNLLAPYLPTIQ